MVSAGCATRQSVLSETISALWSQGGNAALAVSVPANPDMRYRYMRVEVQGKPAALMVMGYADPDPAGEIETWYSASREVIKTQNGRIVFTAGLDTDWVAVRYAIPPKNWDSVPASGLVLQRQRDQMPGYAYGVVDTLWVAPLATAPKEHLPMSLPLNVASSYQWFQQDTHSVVGEPLPRAWFAWGKHRGMQTIVYSEQCLSPSLCLKMQRWPVLEAAQ
jgi:Group 4 capsule polysaccharide lipoprotein gfcB, YjbF